MSSEDLRIELLTKAHDRSTFDCGNEQLNDFLKKHARQNQEADVGRTYVAVSAGRVVGYFAISVGSIAREMLQTDESKRLPRYPVPSAHLGRLAVDQSLHGKGLGGRLLIRAMEIVVQVSDVIGIHVLEVRAKDATAREFYEHFGFKRMLDDDSHLYLSLKAVRRALAN